jgi:uncharacterized protein YktA (UPF0223 family)
VKLLGYQYPLEETWSTEHIVEIIKFFNLIEKAYESSVDRNELLQAYRTFKEIVPSKSEEKVYFAEFEKSSTYSSYHAVKKARESNQDVITMKKKQ